MKDLLRTQLRLLTFQSTRGELLELGPRHLAYGIVVTWLVGMGRWWDDPDAGLLQHLGLGSVVYVLVLAALLTAVMAPLRPADWSYTRVLTFLTMTSAPALLYAIPVERLVPLDDARLLNVWFLGTVAAWRVALLLFFLGRLGRLSWLSRVVGTLLPICTIVVALTVLNLHRVVFDVMGGLRTEGNAHDEAYGVLLWLTMLSVIGFLPLLGAYVAATFQARRAA